MHGTHMCAKGGEDSDEEEHGKKHDKYYEEAIPDKVSLSAIARNTAAQELLALEVVLVLKILHSSQGFDLRCDMIWLKKLV